MPDVRMTIGRKLFRPDIAVGVRASDHRLHRRSGLPGHLQQVRRDAGQDLGHQGSILKATVGNYKLCHCNFTNGAQSDVDGFTGPGC